MIITEKFQKKEIQQIETKSLHNAQLFDSIHSLEAKNVEKLYRIARFQIKIPLKYLNRSIGYCNCIKNAFIPNTLLGRSEGRFNVPREMCSPCVEKVEYFFHGYLLGHIAVFLHNLTERWIGFRLRIGDWRIPPPPTLIDFPSFFTIDCC